MKLFKSTSGRQEIILAVDLNQNGIELEDKLWNWLEQKHHEVFSDIELWQGGSVKISNDEISFRGDNGIFTLEATDVETI